MPSPSDVLNLVHDEADDTFRVKSVSGLPYTVAYEFGANGPLYIGWAAPGSSKAAAVWRIKKYTWSGASPSDEQWADGSLAFTKVWNDRATYTYS